MTTYFTDREIHVCGIQRTGQHAIIVWLIGHFNKVCFKNSIRAEVAAVKDPLYSVSSPWRYYDVAKRGFKLKLESKEQHMRSGQDAVIFGTEYLLPDLRLSSEIERVKEKMVRKYKVDAFSRRQDYILVIRSPWNHLASVLSWKGRWYLKKKERFISCWNSAAREVLGISDILPNPKVFVKFDEWFVSEKCRKKIAEQLDLKFSDKGLNVVMPIGRGRKGSSFDSLKCNGKAQSMKVLDRWKEYKNNSVEFTNVLKMNESLRDMGTKIFGPFPKGL